MPTSGNDAQIRTVADQLFDTWQANQAADGKRKALVYGSIPAWIACVFSILAIFWQAAITSQRVNENTRRIEQLENNDQERSREDKATTQQLARIEAKMDLIINEKGTQR